MRWIGSWKPTSCSSTASPPPAYYRFKHALIQDAAYESLLKSRRQALHRRAADALRDVNAEPEAIAHHFTEADLDYLAIEWWGKAGDQALRRSAFQEAIAHLGKAIAMADKQARGRTMLFRSNHGLTQLQTDYGQRGYVVQGLCGGGNEGSLHARHGASGKERGPSDKQCGRAVGGRLRLMGSAVTCGASCQAMRAHSAEAFCSEARKNRKALISAAGAASPNYAAD